MGDVLLQESIAFLKKSSTNGKNLYDHLSDVIVKILEQKPDNAYSAFENVSFTTPQIIYPHSHHPSHHINHHTILTIHDTFMLSSAQHTDLSSDYLISLSFHLLSLSLHLLYIFHYILVEFTQISTVVKQGDHKGDTGSVVGVVVEQINPKDAAKRISLFSPPAIEEESDDTSDVRLQYLIMHDG